MVSSKGKCPVKKSSVLNCMRNTRVSLLEHQKKVCKFVLNPLHRGVLIFHSVGSGKTLTSLVAAKCLMENFKHKKVIIVTPASLVSNFQKEIDKLDLYFKTKIVLESYDLFIRRKRNICSDSILILDEVHNLNAEYGVKFQKMFECARNAFKVILLTATPVKNNPSEIANQLSLITGEKISRNNVEK